MIQSFHNQQKITSNTVHKSRGRGIFKKSNELLIKKHLDIIFPKRSVMNDFIEKSLFRFGNYIFNDVELLVEKKSKIVNIDIVNSEKLDFLIICIKNKKKFN